MIHSLNKISLIVPIFIIFVGAVNISAETKFLLKNGDRVQIKTKEIKTNHPDYIKRKTINGIVVGFDNDIISISNNWEFKLYRVVRINGSIVEFPYPGAKYDSTSKSIIGIDKYDKLVNIQISEIEYVSVILHMKENHIRTKFTSSILHKRLRFVSRYPEIEYKIPLDSIAEIKKYESRTNSKLVILGTIVGGVLGNSYGNRVATDPKPKWSSSDWNFVSFSLSRKEKIGALTILGAMTGAAIGHLLGTSKWQNIPVENIKFNLKPAYNNGIGLSLAIKF